MIKSKTDKQGSYVEFESFDHDRPLTAEQLAELKREQAKEDKWWAEFAEARMNG